MSDVLELTQTPIEWYVDKLNADQPISVSRWGDGEWRSVLGADAATWERLGKISSAWRKGKTNKSGHSFPPDMGKEMRAMLKDRPKHILTMANRYGNPTSKPPQIHLARWIKEWLVANKLEDIRWGTADTIVRALYNDQFDGFMDALQDKRIIVVGPAHLQKLKVIPVAEHIDVPKRDAYKVNDYLFKMVARQVEQAPDHTVVSISTGPAAALLVERLCRAFGKDHSFLDLGSIWDGFVGVPSRSYMKNPLVKQYIGRIKRKYEGMRNG
jgi:hypothetical protein